MAADEPTLPGIEPANRLPEDLRVPRSLLSDSYRDMDVLKLSYVLRPTLDRYNALLTKSCLHDVVGPRPGNETHPAHLRWMLRCLANPQAPIDGNSPMDYGKMNRWLAFVQAALVFMGQTTVARERELTRGLFAPPAPYVSPGGNPCAEIVLPPHDRVNPAPAYEPWDGIWMDKREEHDSARGR